MTGAGKIRVADRTAAFVLSLLLAAIMFASVPETGYARTATDPCTVDIGGQPPGFTGFGRICGPREQIDALGTSWAGAPLDGLPSADPRQCPRNTRIPGSQFAAIATGWEWDYWAQDGSWVLWDGFDFDAYYARDGAIAFVAPLINWYLFDSWPARVFWTCEPILPATQAVHGFAGDGLGGALPPLHSIGDSGDDSLRGGGGDNALRGLKGDDLLSGADGDDHLHGGPGEDGLTGGDHDDYVHGARGDDRAAGGSGSDDLLTGKGGDVAHGGRHDDQLFDDQGRDRLHGGPGNDRFSAHDGDQDVIDCGPGEDIAVADRKDVVRDCEHVYRSRGDAPKTPPDV